MGLNKLMSDVSALIAAYNTKKTEIDAAVTAAQTAVLANTKTYYVDPVAGLDSNAGTQAAPFGSLWKACASVPVGGIGTINILGDASTVVDMPADIGVYGKTLFIQSTFDANSNKNLHPTIRNNPVITGGMMGSTGFFVRQSQISLVSLRIETAAWPDASLPAAMQEGFIKRLDNSSARVMLMNCRLVLNDTTFIRRPSGPAVIEFGSYGLEIEQAGLFRNAPLLWLEQMPCVFGAHNSILPTGKTWTDLISGIKHHPVTGMPLNVISNIDLSLPNT